MNLKLSDGSHLIAGKRVAGFTNDEEAAVGLTDQVQFLLADKLTEAGAQHVPAPNFTEHVVVDGRLVTGQNPQSARAMAEAVVKTVHPDPHRHRPLDDVVRRQAGAAQRSGGRWATSLTAIRFGGPPEL